MITAWAARRIHGRATVWTVAAVRLWLMAVTVTAVGLTLGLMRDGHLYVDSGEVGVYALGSGIEWSADRPLHAEMWTVVADGAIRGRVAS